MKLFIQFTAYGLATLLASLFLLMAYASISHEPHWEIEEAARPSPSHPMAGFWKQESCEEPWGLAIGPVAPDHYYVSFCGPGGCQKQGEYRPDTALFDDPDYRVLDANTLMFRTDDRWTTMVRCEGRN